MIGIVLMRRLFMNGIRFLDNQGSFALENPENYSYLYFPLAGESGLKSAITPNLGGDSKLDQTSFLLEPVSAENLHNNRSTRNFWCLIDGEEPWSCSGASAGAEADRFTERQEASRVTGGILFHKVERIHPQDSLRAEMLSFIPKDLKTEVLMVTIHNEGQKEKNITGIAAIPIYGRSADNIRDHRNVTSMLHRIRTTKEGVVVTPTMSFDERGHQVNHRSYFVMGTVQGEAPEGFYPTVEEFLGEGGSFIHPAAVYRETQKAVKSGEVREGQEAMGALRFAKKTLRPGEHIRFIVLLGILDSCTDEDLKQQYESLNTEEKVADCLAETKAYWQKLANVNFHVQDDAMDGFLKWVCFQPFLRRLFGCSFLPYHDYGRGGRGWRDLWQDCLSLLLMEPETVRNMILNNAEGMRIDGTNATIIGAGAGEFIADRNGITRVWMDHAVWPLKTILLYIHQSGDVNILLERMPYFKDGQVLRGTALDEEWDGVGLRLKTRAGEQYEGTLLEHLLVEHLTAFYEVGTHNMLQLRGADWNDALDMASERGESVAFTAAYAGNLSDLAGMLRDFAKKHSADTVEVLEELVTLLPDKMQEWTPASRREVLQAYGEKVKHTVQGQTISIRIADLAGELDRMSAFLKESIRQQEWIAEDTEKGWFNSYYDNHGNPVERAGEDPRMMLTGQVFTIMSGTAEPEQIRRIVRAADAHLYQKEIGGYRLNTNFHELKLDMGRMFGFAYGQKENGAVFSHMTVMFAYALYQRGFVKEGYKALQTLADAALNFEKSRIYPGIPEYFAPDGRGMYHYLTGAASWYELTMVTQVFGVRGELGDLVVEPKLVKEQFDVDGNASLQLRFAGKPLEILFRNPGHLDYGAYHVGAVILNEAGMEIKDRNHFVLKREQLEKLCEKKTNRLEIWL